MDEIEEIIWLEDPSKWPYLRETSATLCKHKNVMGKHGWKLVGYTNTSKKESGIQVYTRKMWILQKWDAGCPDDNGKYSADFRPIEAVKPSDIEIPLNVRVINVYEIEKSVPEYSKVSMKNKIWKKSIENGLPFIAIHKYRDYAQFEYDMYTTNFELKEKISESIKSEYLNFIKQMDSSYKKFVFPSKPSWSSAGQTIGRSPKMRIYECHMLANKLKQIIENEDNWIEI